MLIKVGEYVSIDKLNGIAQSASETIGAGGQSVSPPSYPSIMNLYVAWPAAVRPRSTSQSKSPPITPDLLEISTHSETTVPLIF